MAGAAAPVPSPEQQQAPPPQVEAGKEAMNTMEKAQEPLPASPSVLTEETKKAADQRTKRAQAQLDIDENIKVG